MDAIRIRIGCVALDEARRILLVQHRKDGRDYWLLPGGGVEAGETLVEAARRELAEETGLAGEVGRLLLVFESIDAHAGRHILHVAFEANVEPGTLRVGHDGRLVDAAWTPVEALATLPMYPPIGAELLAWHGEGFAGPPRYLGNVWRPMPD